MTLRVFIVFVKLGLHQTCSAFYLPPPLNFRSNATRAPPLLFVSFNHFFSPPVSHYEFK
jgi:hypothetical protein